MEEKSQKDDLKEILNQLKNIMDAYNALNPDERLELKPEVKKEKKADVDDVFVCYYNEGCVGLFKKINWSTKRDEQEFIWDHYYAGSLYVGINSNYIGMKKTHDGYIDYNRWQPVGTKLVMDGKCYVSNCLMSDGMSFDDMRLIMYKNKLIDVYETGKASDKEMLDVLSYAQDYYNKKYSRSRNR